jgi:hypothetical protein
VTTTLRVMGLVVAVAVTVAIAQASVLRMRLNPSDAAVLRLAWTARPERVEDCRPQTEEELSKLPAHMRQSVICEGTTAAYRLEVQYQRQVIAEQVVRGGGLRHDRPLYVSRDIPLPSGDALISVKFVRIDSQKPRTALEQERSERTGAEPLEPGRQSGAMDSDRRRREGEERLHSREEAVPAVLSLERRLRFASRTVMLVTYDAERRELVVIDEPRR